MFRIISARFIEVKFIYYERVCDTVQRAEHPNKEQVVLARAGFLTGERARSTLEPVHWRPEHLFSCKYNQARVLNTPFQINFCPTQAKALQHCNARATIKRWHDTERQTYSTLRPNLFSHGPGGP